MKALLPAPFQRRPILLALFSLLALFAFSSSGCRLLDRAMGNTGAPCSADTDCATGLVCLTESEGFPAGYCSLQTCTNTACPGTFAVCAYLDQSRNVTACVESCSGDADCRQAEGYICADLDGSRGCMPSAISTGSAGSIGSSCTRDDDCGSNLTCMTNYVFGYCSRACSSDADCSGGICNDIGGGVLRCLASCDNNAQCRFGYSCVNLGSGGVCNPAEGGNPVRNPTGAADGAACSRDIDCLGGTCILSDDFPAGYCTTSSCDVVGCASGSSATCVNLDREAVCFANCNESTDCREGYRCTSLDTGGKVCYALSAIETPTVDSGGAVSIRCDASSNGRVRSVSFTASGTQQGIAIIPFSPSQSEVTPLRLRLPDGQTLEFASAYGFQTINSLLLTSIVPMLFPAAPQFDYLMQAGQYTFEYETDDAQSCYFILEQGQLGTRLDVNFYFVGVPGLTASNAPSHANFQTTLGELERIYATAGIDIGTVRYFDVTGSDETRYSIIRDFSDVYRLLATSTAPGSSLSEALSINVFLINDFNISGLEGLLGLSAGIPGVPGVHGNGGAGLVFSSVNLTEAPTALGQTLSHEIGHFLGLRHTSERGGSEYDPISDTPQCSSPENAFACPDVNNLMFPFSVEVDQSTVTAGQRFVLQRNPLVQ
ncbi:MAG: M43 family zinc metalloprotease [Myxococcota bacterium]|jgi:hypothetical protein|nr:M43 family zinc metalloprotease [Myxococcota bacterium]